MGSELKGHSLFYLVLYPCGLQATKQTEHVLPKWQWASEWDPMKVQNAGRRLYI